VTPASVGTQFASSDLEIGQTVTGKGIYTGVWEPKDRQGKSLGKKYAVYAAPEDLNDSNGKKVLLTFKKAAEEVGKLKGWHGHNGANYGNDTAVYKALKNGSYQGEWFIPTREILHGKDLNGNKVQNDNLYDHKDTGDFAGTFTTRASSSDYAYWYWSSTEDRDTADYVYAVRFTDGHGGWHSTDNSRLSVRPVRLEELTI